MQDFLLRMGLHPGMRVLDVGCGTGGSAFYMARHYGVHVHGVDLSTNMIDIAIDRLNREEKYMQSMVINIINISSSTILLIINVLTTIHL